MPAITLVISQGDYRLSIYKSVEKNDHALNLNITWIFTERSNRNICFLLLSDEPTGSPVWEIIYRWNDSPSSDIIRWYRKALGPPTCCPKSSERGLLLLQIPTYNRPLVLCHPTRPIHCIDCPITLRNVWSWNLTKWPILYPLWRSVRGSQPSWGCVASPKKSRLSYRQWPQDSKYLVEI